MLLLENRLCRKCAFLRPNPKITCQTINDLRDCTFLFAVICDRVGGCPSCPFEEVHLSEVFHNVLSGKLTLRGVSSPTAFNDTPWNLQAC